MAGWGDLTLIACVLVINYLLSFGVRDKRVLTLTLVLNIACLATFKYRGFFLNELGVNQDIFSSNIIIPLGISFYIFHIMAYQIDLYRGHAKPADSYLDFACFVSLFPHLVAGPIVRYGIIAEQMRSRVHTVEGFALGLTRFGFGLSKKILLADPMGAIADGAFGAGDGSLTTMTAWIGVIAYAFQIYFDFSAYSDIAVGLARTLGFYFVENFNSPYKSTSITDFWRRWHISLSTFLRDYLYIPLGGNRKGKVRTYVNLMLTMLIGGLWHGASWTFVIWGAIHGGMLAFERMLGKDSLYVKAPAIIKVPLTFFIILITWVFFRAENFEVATRYLGIMFGGGDPKPTALLLQAELLRGFNVLQLFLCAVGAWAMPNTPQILHRFTLWKAILGLVLFLAAVAMMFTRGHSPFLYFQF